MQASSTVAGNTACLDQTRETERSPERYHRRPVRLAQLRWCFGSSSAKPITTDEGPIYQAIVETLREEGIAGATVLRGIEGFGASRLHTAWILRLSEDLPIVIESADRADRIDAMVAEV